MVEEVKVPTQEWLDAQKKKYGRMFKVVISGKTYIYRYMTRSEFKEIQKSIEPEMTPTGPIVTQAQALELEDKVVSLCLLWPEDFNVDSVEAGVSSQIAAFVSNSSGFVVDEEPVEL